MLRETMKLPDVVKKESGHSFYCDRCVHQNEVYSFGDGIYNSHDSVDGDQREFDLETRVTTNGNMIISKMFHSCALNK